MTETIPVDTQDRLQNIVALLSAATTQLLERPAATALEHATDLIDLHLSEGQIRLHLDPAHQDIPTVLVCDHPSVLLLEAAQLLDALPEDDRADLHETRMLLERALNWVGERE